MTVCAALITSEGVWLGADSLAADESLASLSATPKVGRFGDLLIGFAGSWKAGEQMFDLASKAHMPTMRQLLDNFQTEAKDYSFLFIEDGKIYEVDDELAAVCVLEQEGVAYGAIGSGAPVALGSLFVCHDDESALMQALEAAEAHVPTVRGPFRIVSL